MAHEKQIRKNGLTTTELDAISRLIRMANGQQIAMVLQMLNRRTMELEKKELM